VSDSLKVGDLAIVLPNPHADKSNVIWERYNGEEVELVSWDIPRSLWVVQVRGGPRFCVAPELLRKKRPPGDGATWKKIQAITGWNPTKRTVRA